MARQTRQVGLRDRSRLIFSRQELLGVTNVKIAEICEVDPQTVAGWRTWAGVGRGTGMGSAPPSAQLDRVERYLDEAGQAEMSKGITFRDAHMVLDQAERLGVSPEAAYDAAVRLVAVFKRLTTTADSVGDEHGPSGEGHETTTK